MISSANPPGLVTRRPTPATVAFTVSTRAPAHTLTARLLHRLSLAARVLVGLGVLVLFWAKWHALSSGRGPQAAAAGPQGLRPSDRAAAVLYWLAHRVQSRYLIPSGALALWAVVRRGYTEESLLVLRGLGVQTSSSAPTYLSTSATRFIPTASIQDVFIHEAFEGFEVRFYLAIVVEGEHDVVVVFPNILPKRQILEEVWRGARACLYEPKT